MLGERALITWSINFCPNTQFTKNRDDVYGESISQPDPLQYGVKTRKPFRSTLRGELRSMNSLFQHETRVSQFRIVETVQPAGRVPYDQTSTMYPESFAVNYATKCNFLSLGFIFTLLTYCSGIY